MPQKQTFTLITNVLGKRFLLSGEMEWNIYLLYETCLLKGFSPGLVFGHREKTQGKINSKLKK